MAETKYNRKENFRMGWETVDETKNLTLRFSLQQMLYWALYAVPISFAAAYLLDKGFRPAQVGVVLACANFGSCLLQPVLASYADRARRPVLPGLLTALAALRAPTANRPKRALIIKVINDF